MSIRQLDAPLILYPASANLPKGLYFQTFGEVEIGKIAAFPVPNAARQYQAQRGDHSSDDFLFMKPIVAGPGDQVCNSAAGLFLTGKRWAAVASHNAQANRCWSGKGVDCPIAVGISCSLATHRIASIAGILGR